MPARCINTQDPAVVSQHLYTSTCTLESAHVLYFHLYTSIQQENEPVGIAFFLASLSILHVYNCLARGGSRGVRIIWELGENSIPLSHSWARSR